MDSEITWSLLFSTEFSLYEIPDNPWQDSQLSSPNTMGYSFLRWKKISMVLLHFFPIKISSFRWHPNPEILETTHQHVTVHSAVFIISGTFHHHKSYRNLQGQHKWKYRGHEHLWLHLRHITNLGTPQKTISYFHYTNYSTRFTFLHTT